MKKFYMIIAVVAIAMLSASTGQAQELGIRFGRALGNNNSASIDGIFGTGKYSRIHANVSFGNGVGAEALWDFLYRPLSDSPFNWYVGVGPSVFLGDPFILGASGEIGLEYRFPKAPIAMGLDYRPTFVIIENTDFYNSFGFNVRYVFGSK